MPTKSKHPPIEHSTDLKIGMRVNDGSYEGTITGFRWINGPGRAPTPCVVFQDKDGKRRHRNIRTIRRGKLDHLPTNWPKPEPPDPRLLALERLKQVHAEKMK
jgi:hypothetical protein